MQQDTSSSTPVKSAWQRGACFCSALTMADRVAHPYRQEEHSKCAGLTVMQGSPAVHILLWTHARVCVAVHAPT